MAQRAITRPSTVADARMPGRDHRAPTEAPAEIDLRDPGRPAEVPGRSHDERSRAAFAHDRFVVDWVPADT